MMQVGFTTFIDLEKITWAEILKAYRLSAGDTRGLTCYFELLESL